MTTKDKTGDRLVASIRRTKAGAEGTAEVTDSTKKPAPAKPATSRSAARRKGTPTTDVGGAGYQFGRRVWPD